MMPKSLNAASSFESEALRSLHCEYFICKDYGSMIVTHKTDRKNHLTNMCWEVQRIIASILCNSDFKHPPAR